MIPVYEPIIAEDEIQAVVNALRRKEISGSFGKELNEFEESFASYVGCKYGIAVSSGTTALHLAVAVAKIKEDDEVLVSASTNIATALAVFHNGAVIVPVDSEEVTWNLNLDLIESLITEKTRAIIVVHLYGHPVNMKKLCEIAKKYNLLIIEDCAESHGAKYEGKITGSFGHMGCFSFYANKIITTGEGGMITTNDPYFAERARLLRNLAFIKPRFYHEEAGYNFRLTNYQAAMGLAQLKKIDKIIEEKRRVAKTYNFYLKDIEGLQLPVELENCYNVYWMYAIVIKPEFGISRDDLMKFLAEKGIETRTFFCPINKQPFLLKSQKMRYVPCPVAEKLWETGLYLPSSPNLKEETIAYICETIKKAQKTK
ncbi:MAG: DegT/DnrJ/EryC1/StrS family aminotransferase [Bacteroidales bacterium]|nr:DegT/DnrJ/EryC1/StrS family aminotransferase [Bacteroidales bacterium]